MHEYEKLRDEKLRGELLQYVYELQHLVVPGGHVIEA